MSYKSLPRGANPPNPSWEKKLWAEREKHRIRKMVRYLNPEAAFAAVQRFLAKLFSWRKRRNTQFGEVGFGETERPVHTLTSLEFRLLGEKTHLWRLVGFRKKPKRGKCQCRKRECLVSCCQKHGVRRSGVSARMRNGRRKYFGKANHVRRYRQLALRS